MAADNGAIAAAMCTKAFVHLSVGDVEAAANDGRASIAAARSRSRSSESGSSATGARGKSTVARIVSGPPAAIVNRLRHVARDRLPPLLRLRCDLLHELLSIAGNRLGRSLRRIASTGLQALALYLPDASTPRSHPAGWGCWTEEIVDILSICQTAEDEATVLGEVCSKVRRQLHAASVAHTSRGTRSAQLSSRPAEIGLISPSRRVRSKPASRSRRTATTTVSKRPRPSGTAARSLVRRGAMDAQDRPTICREHRPFSRWQPAPAPSAVSAVLARRTSAGTPAVSELLGAAPVMVELAARCERAAAAPFAVLVEGESGTGKELIARALHRLGPRRDRPFCTLNCAALPDDLVEAELFGHVRGAFTGAVGDRPGVFEEANGGTLFLDEIGELSARAQAKLLRVVQEGELRRVGENLSRRIDVRIVAATNRELRQEPPPAISGRICCIGST